MESPDQQPKEENLKERAEEIGQQFSDEDIQRGLVYPPPPSYYQNMQVPTEHPPLPLPSQPPMKREAVHGSYDYLTPSYSPPRGGAPGSFAPPQIPTQPAIKKPNKWLWILIAVLGLSFLFSCGLCSWAVLAVSNTLTQRINTATNVVNDYYNAISKQNYIAAYPDLAVQSNGPSQEQFITQAQNNDTQNGPVIFYSAEQPSFNTNPASGAALSTFKFTVDVTRMKLKNKYNYTVQLTVSEIDGTWKITDYSRI